MNPLPDHAQRLAESWGFVAEEELQSGHCSRIFADREWVLKVPFQGEELTSGAIAAERIMGAGGPDVVRVDRATGVVLMERITPGTDLAESSLSEEERQAVFAGLAVRMRGLATEDATPMGEFYRAVDHDLLDELLKSTDSPVFLHGDLHHYNILFDRGIWRPIDPKGLVGDAHFEPVAYLRNPLLDLQEIDDLYGFTRMRLLSLAERLLLNPWRIAAWGFIDSHDSDNPPEHPWSRLNGVYAQIMKSLG